MIRRTLPTGWVLELNRSLQEPRQSGEEAWEEGQIVLARRAEVRETKLLDNFCVINSGDVGHMIQALKLPLGISKVH